MAHKIGFQLFTAAPRENGPEAPAPEQAQGQPLYSIGLSGLSKAAKGAAKASTNALRNASIGASALREQASALVFGPPPPPASGLQKMLNTASELVPGAVKSAAQDALGSVTQGAASLREQASALVYGPPPPPPTGLQKMLNSASELVPGAVKSAAQDALGSVTQGAASLREQASALVFGPPEPPPSGLQKMLNSASELVPGAVKSAAHGALDSVTQGAASLREQASALVFGTPPTPMPGTFPKASEAGPFDR